MVPDACLSPANEAIVASRVWPIVPWQVTPRRTRTQDPEDVIEHATVIYTSNAARLVRQHRLDGGPFIIAEFVAHRLELRVRGSVLESRLGEPPSPASGPRT